MSARYLDRLSIVIVRLGFLGCCGGGWATLRLLLDDDVHVSSPGVHVWADALPSADTRSISDDRRKDGLTFIVGCP